MRPRTTSGSEFSSRTTRGAGGFTPRKPAGGDATTVRPWSFTLAFTSLIITLALARSTLPVNSAVTSGAAQKLTVYQGVAVIAPGGAADSILELGNAGRDIASTGDIFLRPDAQVQVNGNLAVTEAVYLNGVAKGSWPIQVCAVDGGACLGPWVGTKLMDDATKFNEQLCYFRQADPGPPAVTADVVCVDAFVNTPTFSCPLGYSPETRSSGGTSYFLDGCGGDLEYVLGGESPYTGDLPPNVCRQDVPGYVTVSDRWNAGSGCTSVSLNKSFARIRNRISVADWHQVYELR